MTYQPTLQDAIAWSASDEKFTFVQDLVGGFLTDNPDEVEARVDAVEEAFEDLLDNECNALLDSFKN